MCTFHNYSVGVDGVIRNRFGRVMKYVRDTLIQNWRVHLLIPRDATLRVCDIVAEVYNLGEGEISFKDGNNSNLSVANIVIDNVVVNGVYRLKNGLWRAHFNWAGSKVFVGDFVVRQDAILAVIAKKEELCME